MGTRLQVRRKRINGISDSEISCTNGKRIKLHSNNSFISDEYAAEYDKFRDFDDSIKVVNVQTAQRSSPPDEVDSSSPWMRTSPKAGVEKEIFKYGRPRTRRQHSIVENFKRLVLNKNYSEDPIHSSIKIEHSQQDHVLGDDFGAEIESYPYSDKYHNDYWLHFFIKIEPESVAQNLSLREYDELVLLNDEFVPSMTHNDLVARFKNLPVDSHTPLKLIIRRMPKEHNNKDITFQWIKIQAILVPEYDTEPRTIVTKLHSEHLENAPSKKQNVYIKLEENSKYVSIRNHVIGASLLQNNKPDNSAIIVMETKIKYDPNIPNVYYFASLYSEQNGYVSVKDQEVNLAEQPFEFTLVRQGNYSLFKHKDWCLGYEGECMKMKAPPYKFQVFPHV